MLSSKVYAPTALAFLLISQSVVAKSENAYGPVHSGQTLWDIAAEVRPDDSVSIIQLVHSLYALNPSAFASGNMNLLQKGAYLEMPTKDKVLSMTHQEAQVIFSQHAQALVSLRSNAGTLNKAKKKRSQYRKQVKSLQKKLGKFRHKSGAWNNVYKKLVKSKQLQKKWNKEVVSIREALVAKTINPSPSATIGSGASGEKANTSGFSALNARMDQMQSSVSELQNKLALSNKNLAERIKSQASMEQRFTVLENELGKKEKIILKLRSTLRVAATAMKKQQVENKALNKRLQAFDPNFKPASAKPKLELQSATVANEGNDTTTSITTNKPKYAEVVSVPEVSLKQESAKVIEPKSVPASKNTSPSTSSAKPMTAKSTPAVSTTQSAKAKTTQVLSRDEKRRLRMAKANQSDSQSFMTLAFWKNLITKNLMMISAIMGALVLLVVSYTVISGRRRKKLKAKALAEKHDDLFISAGKLSDITTGDDNISQMNLKKAS